MSLPTFNTAAAVAVQPSSAVVGTSTFSSTRTLDPFSKTQEILYNSACGLAEMGGNGTLASARAGRVQEPIR